MQSTTNANYRLVIFLCIAVAAALVPAAFAAGASPPEPDLAMFDTQSGRWHIREADGDEREFFFGRPSDQPLMGDWDCDGTNTAGVFRPSTGQVHLRDSNTPGPADRVFFFGAIGDVALAGDWNGDGCDTVSVYRPSLGQFFISNTLRTRNAARSFYYGIPGDVPVAGDFDGDGTDGVGIRRGGEWFLRFDPSPGAADMMFGYGKATDQPVVGDWDGNGADGVSFYRPTTGVHHLANKVGGPSQQLSYGEPSWLAVSGVPGSSPADTGSQSFSPPPTDSPASGPATTPFGVVMHPKDSDVVFAEFSGAQLLLTPASAYEYLEQARETNTSLFVVLAHRRDVRNADESFNLERWKAQVDMFAGLDLDRYAADGTIRGHYLVDSPKSAGQWGGTPISNEVLDEMARYSRTLWPSLLTVVDEAPRNLEAGGTTQWTYLDSARAEYRSANGPVSAFAAAEAASAKEQGLTVMFGINVVFGGDGTSGIQSAGARSVVSVDELQEYGSVLLEHPGSCGLILYRYSRNYGFFGQPGMNEAMHDLMEQAGDRADPCFKAEGRPILEEPADLPSTTPITTTLPPTTGTTVPPTTGTTVPATTTTVPTTTATTVAAATTTTTVPATTTTTVPATTTTLPTPAGGGVPFGFFVHPSSVDETFPRFTAVKVNVTKNDAYDILEHARQTNTRVVIHMNVGKNYSIGTTNPKKFSLEKWKANVDRLASIDFAPYVADGTIIAHYMIDEPKTTSHWSKAITNPVLDEMARYSKQLWPTLPTVVRQDPHKLDKHAGGKNVALPDFEWQHLDMAWAQYNAQKLAWDSVEEYAAGMVAHAREQGLGLVWGLQANYGGDGSSGYPNRAMSAAEVVEYGTVLLEQGYGCAFIAFRWDNKGESHWQRTELKKAVNQLEAVAASSKAGLCQRR